MPAYALHPPSRAEHERPLTIQRTGLLFSRYLSIGPSVLVVQIDNCSLPKHCNAGARVRAAPALARDAGRRAEHECETADGGRGRAGNDRYTPYLIKCTSK